MSRDASNAGRVREVMLVIPSSASGMWLLRVHPCDENHSQLEVHIDSDSW